MLLRPELTQSPHYRCLSAHELIARLRNFFAQQSCLASLLNLPLRPLSPICQRLSATPIWASKFLLTKSPAVLMLLRGEGCSVLFLLQGIYYDSGKKCVLLTRLFTVIGLEQNTKKENKTLRLFRGELIPDPSQTGRTGSKDPYREEWQGPRGRLRRGLLQRAALPQDEGSSSKKCIGRYNQPSLHADSPDSGICEILHKCLDSYPERPGSRKTTDE